MHRVRHKADSARAKKQRCATSSPKSNGNARIEVRLRSTMFPVRASPSGDKVRVNRQLSFLRCRLLV